MKTHQELLVDVTRLESECRTLENAALDQGRFPNGRPVLGANPTTEQVQRHVAFLETHAASLRIQDRLSRPLKGVSQSARTLEQIAADSVALRARLEAKQPGCTARINGITENATLDEIFDEEKALKAVESGMASKTSVESRGASAPAETQTKVVKSAKEHLLSGSFSAAQIGKASEIVRLENLLTSYKPGSTTHAALASKIATLRSELESQPKPSGK